MTETLVTADAEAAAVAELDDRYPAVGFDGIHVGTKIPGTKPADFVRVLVVGGANRDIANDQVTLVVEGWSTKEARAQRITALGAAALEAAGRDGFIGDVPCTSVRVPSIPANLPDPTVSTHYRYTSTISAVLRRTAV